MNLKLIAIHAPPAPKCFDTRSIWIEYLHSAQQSAAGGGRTSNAIKPFVDGRYSPEYPFCRDCSARHAHAMTRAGRCDHKGYVASITPAEAEPAKETSNAA